MGTMDPTSSHNGSSRTFRASQGLGGKTGNAAHRSYPLHFYYSFSGPASAALCCSPGGAPVTVRSRVGSPVRFVVVSLKVRIGRTRAETGSRKGPPAAVPEFRLDARLWKRAPHLPQPSMVESSQWPGSSCTPPWT